MSGTQTLRVKATPNASKNKIIGWEHDHLAGDVLRVRIQSPPVDGKANKALTTYLAKALGISKSSITLTKGQTSRIKTFEIPANAALPEKE
ncbi:hypothetical protein SAMN02745181_2130 [Rubritalea squalenifaciens DSM 18772]|uniref:UPF0235 protein SAMN02745181_2130 n=1 Tax=Rubritalea squalenifaciens DSM 18772 TaxID=1123071 RepID=A0A1M6JI70_9BACT|nr:DUF167 domain-containing protein [Rubritalea squalenifaciens]SHJ46345.1 hypothetical protein SAMN02745181_2130 [Rubritalea squalenifaciens DSM 18772]